MISLQGFREWAVAARQVSNPQVGTYPGQCVSLVQQYIFQVFAVAYASRGNAKDFVPPGFTRVTGAYRAGDIIRYGANYGGGYGHIGLIDDNGQWLDQNGVAVLHVGQRATPFSSIESIWRPNNAFSIKSPSVVRLRLSGRPMSGRRPIPPHRSPVRKSSWLARPFTTRLSSMARVSPKTASRLISGCNLISTTSYGSVT
jgi:hypothetical protein